VRPSRWFTALVVSCSFAAVGGVAVAADDPGSTAAPVPLGWAADAPVLGIGASGSAVATWQAAMNTWLESASPSTSRLDVDGVYGRLTDSVTRQFQFAQGLPVDGLVGPVTRAAFLSAPALVERGRSPVALGPFLAPGDRGDAVANWQSALNRWTRAARAWVDPLAVDGVYGPLTVAATKVFQQSQGITIDGLTGPETRAALASAPALVNGPPTAAPDPSQPASDRSATDRPAAGICSASDAPIAEIDLGPDIPTPRCLAMSGAHWLRVVNDGGPTHITLGSWEVDLDAGATVTSPLPVGAYLDPGAHLLVVSRYGATGPDLRVR